MTRRPPGSVEPVAVATVAAAETSWAGVAAQLRSRAGTVSTPSQAYDGLLGSWSGSQRDLFEVMAVVDAVRTNADTVPVSLRSFLS